MDKASYLKKVPKRFLHYREWAIDEIKVKVVDENLAFIYYEKYEVNAYKHSVQVSVNWFERRKGITLESKIEYALTSLKSRLEKENLKIVEHKRLEEKFK